MTESLGTFLSPDESCELGIIKEDNALYAGFISNSGISRTWKMEYDDNFSLDQNLEALFEYITETYDYYE